MKEAPKTQVTPNLSFPPPSLPTDLGLKAILDLRKKRPIEELEEGEVVPHKGAKQQKKSKDPKDKRDKLVESQDKAEICRGHCTWAPRLEMDGAPISWVASI